MAVSSMDVVLWMRPDPGGSLLDDVRAERRTLHEARHGAEYRSGIFKPHGNRTSLAFVPAVQHDLLALTLEILTRDSVTGAAQEQRDAFREVFSELDTFVNTKHAEGHVMETAKMVVDTLRPVAETLRRTGPTPQRELEPHEQLDLAFSGAASTAAQDVGVEPEQELRSDWLLLTSS